MLEIQENNPYTVKTTWFSKAQESKNGADWEWWFLSRGMAVGFLVQAKRLDVRSQEYKAFNEDQLTKLIQECDKSLIKRIPIYVFYNHFRGKSLSYNYNYACLPDLISLHGCSVASARLINSKRSRKLKDLSQLMYPWSSLVCCGDPSKSLAHKAAFFITNELEKQYKGDFNSENFFGREAPEYVYKLINNELLDEKDWYTIGARRLLVIKDY